MSGTVGGRVFDPDVAAWLRARAADPTAADLSVEGERAHSRAVNDRARALLRHPARPAAEYDITLAYPDGPVSARVYHPGTGGLHPTIVYFHGGGWIAGGTDTHAQHARRLCVETASVVVSVDYRLAPEHTFPAAFEDCVAATRHVAAHIAGFGGAPDRIVVAGDSAGGQLAASVAIACRNESLPLAAQLLIVPATDLAGGYADDALNARHPSRIENSRGYGLTTAGMAGFVRRYGVDPSACDWRASPLCAPDLTGVAPAIVYTAGFDVLRDEGAAYARRLSEDGVRVVQREWPTLNHGYFSLGGVSATAERAARTAGRDLNALLSGYVPGSAG